jgi:hypothetical protein
MIVKSFPHMCGKLFTIMEETGVCEAIQRRGTPRAPLDVLHSVSDRNETRREARPANLILIEQSGAKREIPQPSAVNGMIEAQEAIHRHGGPQLRQVKLISEHKAIARWKAGETGWRRVA